MRGTTKALVDCVPFVEQILLTSSGSEATFHALRLARAVERRHRNADRLPERVQEGHLDAGTEERAAAHGAVEARAARIRQSGKGL